LSAEPDWVTPEGRLRWFSEHDAERDAARAERDVARADLADLRARIAVLADVMAHVADDDDNFDSVGHWDEGWSAACREYSDDVRALIACPTCGGTAWVDWTDDHPGGLCPDCTKETT